MSGTSVESTFEGEHEPGACVYLKIAGGEVRLEIEDVRMSFGMDASPDLESGEGEE